MEVVWKSRELFKAMYMDRLSLHMPDPTHRGNMVTIVAECSIDDKYVSSLNIIFNVLNVILNVSMVAECSIDDKYVSGLEVIVKKCFRYFWYFKFCDKVEIYRSMHLHLK